MNLVGGSRESGSVDLKVQHVVGGVGVLGGRDGDLVGGVGEAGAGAGDFNLGALSVELGVVGLVTGDDFVLIGNRL